MTLCKECIKKMEEISNRIQNGEDQFSPEIRSIEEDILRCHVKEIVNIAYDNWVSGGCDGLAIIDLDSQNVKGMVLTGNDYISDEANIIELFRIKSNFLGNCSLQIGDIIDENEWEQLEEIYGINADDTSEEQLKTIGIDFDERLKNFFVHNILN